MTLKGRTKIVSIKHAKTQYIAIPAELTSDSQYPFLHDEEVEVVVIPNERKIEIIGTGSIKTKGADPIEKKIKSTEAGKKAWRTMRSRKSRKK